MRKGKTPTLLMLKEVFITKLSKFLPNEPIENDQVEHYLGMIDNTPSRARRIVLRNNGIKTRHYSLNKEGKISHNNAELVYEAIKGLEEDNFSIDEIDLLACGTSLIDQMLPSHAAMVHGLLKTKPMEIISPSGACCSGMHAFKYAYLSVSAGNSKNAVCAGSEMISPMLQGKNFEPETKNLNDLNENPYIAFEKDFLRWMLSDGAGVALMEDKPRGDISLKVEWVESISFANELETCMYAAADKDESGKLRGWKEFGTDQWLNNSIFAMKQDVKMLSKNIASFGAKHLIDACEKRGFDLNELDYLLPHLSSEFFRKKVADSLEELGHPIPQEKWFTNLTRVGNVGSASIYLMMEELVASGKLKKGQKIILTVPESARFSYAFSLLTVV